MPRWSVIAPVRYTDRAKALNSEIQLGDSIQLTRCPRHLSTESVFQRIGNSAEAWVKACDFALSVEYDASSFQDIDPNWKGPEPRTKEAWATELIYLSYLALWLTRPTEFEFRTIFLSTEGTEGWQYIWHNDFKPMWHLPRDDKSAFLKEDFVSAGLFLKTLLSLKRDNAAWIAARTILQAHAQDWWEGRYLLIWIAMEALFGPENAREITYRLSLRASHFLSSDPVERKSIFNSVKNNYSLRSAVVHGMRIARLSEKQSEQAMLSSDDILRRALSKLLAEPKLLERFSGSKREEFLDDLVFS